MTVRSSNPGERETRYRLDIFAPNVLDAVKSAGGWLFDCAMAGWDVTVMVQDHGDPRPLQILGADVVDLGPAMSSWEQRLHPHSMAVAADLFDRDARVKQTVLHALEHGMTDVTLWGERWPAGLGGSVDEMRHELSSAASAFKSQALAAAKKPEAQSVGEIETFRRVTVACPAPLLPWQRRPRHRTA